MNRKRSLKFILLFTILALLFIYRFSYYPFSMPLNVVSSTLERPEPKSVAIELENKGRVAIKIHKVLLNTGESPIEFSLLDTAKHTIILNDPDRIEASRLDHYSILPNNKSKDIRYNLYIRNEKPIESVDISYKYFGVGFTLKHRLSD
jgi:hypothetical protein